MIRHNVNTPMLIGIDCGTTALKGVLCRVDGQEVARAQRSLPLLTPRPGWAEQDPETVWQALCDVTRSLASQAASGRIAALSIGAQAGSVLLLDAAGQPVHPVITFLDTRAADIVSRWRQKGWGDFVRQHTGWGLQIGQPLASVAWLKTHRADVFSAARWFIGPHDDLVRRLTGKLVSTPSCAAQMPLIERHSNQWCAAVAEHVGVSLEQLPPLMPSGALVGAVLPEIADELGLPRSTAVVVGGQDHACEALALGLLEPGGLMLATGTAWVITGVTDSAALEHVPPQMDLNAHVAPQRWTISTYMGGFGAVLEWWLNATPSPATDKYALLNSALEHTSPDADNPFFLPESQQRQASLFAGLRLSHTWSDMTRSVVEGITFETRRGVEALRQAQLPVKVLYMLGGAARSSQWAAILADATSVPIRACDDPFLGARGAAILAGLGAEMYASAEEAWRHFAPRFQEHTPFAPHSALYDARFKQYCDLAT